jgi:hemerythrin superfamily protein
MPSRNSSTSTSTSARSSAKNQIIEMLKADHKKVKKAFKDFEKLDPQEDPESCQALVEQTLAEIEVHAELEEQVFYPAARSAIKEEDLMDEAEVEHMTAKVLIQQLKDMGPEDEKFAATFKVLGEYINHHVQEEEGEMFKQLTRPGVDWDSTLEQMQEQRVRLLEEKGLPAEGSAEEEEAGASSGRSGASRSSSRSQGESRPQASSKSSKSASEKK